MRYAIIVSKQDPAGLNIKESLLNLYSFKETEDGNWIFDDIGLFEIGEDSINAEKLDKNILANYFIFATMHKSAAGTNSLSVHPPGNWGEAKLGGKSRKLCMTSASLMKALFLEVNKNKLDDYEVTLEATHHGPLLKTPSCFIEIGSSEKQWKNKDAGNAIAKTIMNTLKKPVKNYETILGIGSTHYPPSFNRIVLETDFAISHMCPKYALEHLDKKLIQEAIDKTKEKVSFVVLDWKSLGQNKERILKALEDLNLDFKKTKELKKIKK